MAQGRQTQHRQEREQAKGKELSEARREIKQLKRQISRLHKTIKKLEEMRGVEIELEEASPDPVEPTPAQVEQSKCHCGSSDLTKFTTPGGKLLIACRTCKSRW